MDLYKTWLPLALDLQCLKSIYKLPNFAGQLLADYRIVYPHSESIIFKTALAPLWLKALSKPNKFFTELKIYCFEDLDNFEKIHVPL